MKQLLAKYKFFHEIAQISHSQKSYFLKYNWNFLDQLHLLYRFCGRDM